MLATVFEIAEGRGSCRPPPWYKVWVPKGLIKEGLSSRKPHACWIGVAERKSDIPINCNWVNF